MGAATGIMLTGIGLLLLLRTGRAVDRPVNRLRLGQEKGFLAAAILIVVLEVACFLSGMAILWRVDQALTTLIVALIVTLVIIGHRVGSDKAVVTMVFNEYRNQKGTSRDLEEQAILLATAAAVLGRLGWDDDRIQRVSDTLFNKEKLPYLQGVRDVKDLAGKILWVYSPTENRRKVAKRFRILDQICEEEKT